MPNFVQGAMRNALSIQANPSQSMANAQRALASSGNLALKLTALIDQEEQNKVMNLQRQQQLDETGRHNLAVEDYQNRALKINDENTDNALAYQYSNLNERMRATDINDENTDNALAYQYSSLNERMRNNDMLNADRDATRKIQKEGNYYKYLNILTNQHKIDKPATMYDADGNILPSGELWLDQGSKLKELTLSTMNGNLDPNKVKDVFSTTPEDMTEAGNKIGAKSLMIDPKAPVIEPLMDETQLGVSKDPYSLDSTTSNALELPGKQNQEILDEGKKLEIKQQVKEFLEQNPGHVQAIATRLKTTPTKMVEDLNKNDMGYDTKSGVGYKRKSLDSADEFYIKEAANITGMNPNRIHNKKQAEKIVNEKIKTDPISILETAGVPEKIQNKAINSLGNYFTNTDIDKVDTQLLRRSASLLNGKPGLIDKLQDHMTGLKKGDTTIVMGRLKSMMNADKIIRENTSQVKMSEEFYKEEIEPNLGLLDDAKLSKYIRGFLKDVGPVDQALSLTQSNVDAMTKSLGIIGLENAEKYGAAFVDNPKVLKKIGKLTDVQIGGTSIHFNEVYDALERMGENFKGLKPLVKEYKEKVELARGLKQLNLDNIPDKETIDQWANLDINDFSNIKKSATGSRRKDLMLKRKVATIIKKNGIDNANFLNRPLEQVKNEMFKSVSVDRLKEELARSGSFMNDDKATVAAFVTMVDISKVAHEKVKFKDPLTTQVSDTMSSAGKSLWNTVTGPFK